MELKEGLAPISSLGTTADLERLEDRMMGSDTRMSELATRAEMNQGFAAVRGEIAGLRGDLTQVALAVDARPPRAAEA